tara:strand:- start:302 stop:1012 length:711 start_codon:yes stop_codon:yes gene_type:complete
VDQELEELRRRWSTSGDPDERQRYVQAQARAEGRSVEWVEFRLQVQAYSRQLLQGRVRELYERKVRPGSTRELAGAVQRVVGECVGSWFGGLSEDWNPAWCACHCLPKGPDDVERGVQRVLSQVDAVHGYNLDLIALGEGAPQESDSLDEARALGEAVIEAVIRATRCNEAWYQEVAPALELVLLGRGVGDVDLEPLADLISASFSSWTQPSPSARSEALDLYALSAAEAGLAGAE